MTLEEYTDYSVRNIKASGRTCFNCEKVIGMKDDMVSIVGYHSKVNVSSYLYFHHDCFVQVAGTQYHVEINGVDRKTGVFY